MVFKDGRKLKAGEKGRERPRQCVLHVGATARPPHVSGPRRGPVRTRALLTSNPQHLLGCEGCGARLRVPCGRGPCLSSHFLT